MGTYKVEFERTQRAVLDIYVPDEDLDPQFFHEGGVGWDSRYGIIYHPNIDDMIPSTDEWDTVEFSARAERSSDD